MSGLGRPTQVNEVEQQKHFAGLPTEDIGFILISSPPCLLRYGFNPPLGGFLFISRFRVRAARDRANRAWLCTQSPSLAACMNGQHDAVRLSGHLYALTLLVG